MEIRSVAWNHPGAVALRDAMSDEMNIVYADRLHAFPQSAFHVADADVVWTGLAVLDDTIIGHVALRTPALRTPALRTPAPRTPADGTRAGAEVQVEVEVEVELKRMIVAPAYRGHGVAGALLRAAHEEAFARGYRRVLLQTGDRQPAAVALYERAGYTRVSLFPPYEEVTFSICMAMTLDGRDARASRPDPDVAPG